MKYAVLMTLFLSLLTVANAHGDPATDPVVSSIGLPIGAKAPAFAATDQLGHEQSNETLRGSNGTVLLFFRSADW